MLEEHLSEVSDQLTEEEEKTKSLTKLKNKQEAVIADLEGELVFFLHINMSCSKWVNVVLFTDSNWRLITWLHWHFAERLKREEQGRLEQEKWKRRMESESLEAQEQLSELGMLSAELRGTLAQKEKEITTLQGRWDSVKNLTLIGLFGLWQIISLSISNCSYYPVRLEEEGARRAEAQRALREALSQVSELKEEVENERGMRERAEKQKRDLGEELEALRTELEDTLDTTAAQQELR